MLKKWKSLNTDAFLYLRNVTEELSLVLVLLYSLCLVINSPSWRAPAQVYGFLKNLLKTLIHHIKHLSMVPLGEKLQLGDFEVYLGLDSPERSVPLPVLAECFLSA